MTIATYIIGAIAIVSIIFSTMIISYEAGRRAAIKEITEKVTPYLNQFQEALKRSNNVPQNRQEQAD